ncbi:hypothetical protein LBMAG42_39150 [Deltaproteobacteria bacterium]|nr:hypothetical protein LBMAG42_39150 [Deltaproteobacteria bacterium]
MAGKDRQTASSSGSGQAPDVDSTAQANLQPRGNAAMQEQLRAQGAGVEGDDSEGQVITLQEITIFGDATGADDLDAGVAADGSDIASGGGSQDAGAVAGVDAPTSRDSDDGPAEVQAEPEQQVDDAEVKAVIQGCYDRSSFKTEPARTEDAWAESLKLRRKAPQDVNYAAAEHYLYAKFQGKKNGVVGAAAVGVGAMGYDAVKAVLFGVGAEGILPDTDGAPSRPTLGSTEWGLKGAADGLGDE